MGPNILNLLIPTLIILKQKWIFYFRSWSNHKQKTNRSRWIRQKYSCNIITRSNSFKTNVFVEYFNWLFYSNLSSRSNSKNYTKMWRIYSTVLNGRSKKNISFWRTKWVQRLAWLSWIRTILSKNNAWAENESKYKFPRSNTTFFNVRWTKRFQLWH